MTIDNRLGKGPDKMIMMRVTAGYVFVEKHPEFGPYVEGPNGQLATRGIQQEDSNTTTESSESSNP